jgi:hypothetical protein
MGEAFLAEDTKLDRKVALKILPAVRGVDVKIQMSKTTLMNRLEG